MSANMQLAASLDEIPSLPGETPDFLNDLDSLLASPSAWDAGPSSAGQLDLPADPFPTTQTSDAPTSESPVTDPASNAQGVAQQHRHMSKDDRKLAMSREVQKRCTGNFEGQCLPSQSTSTSKFVQLLH